jgi:hypothetical protein
MNASCLVSVLGCCFFIGCGSVVQPGLANAPSLGGVSPETRVHDVVANGHDACERSMFPQGEVLRGQIPPCIRKESFRRSNAFVPPTVTVQASLSRPYPFGVCPAGPEPHALRTDKATREFPLTARWWWLACDLRDDATTQ